MNKLIILFALVTSFSVGALEVVDNRSGNKQKLESFSIEDLEKAIGQRRSKCGENSKCLKPKSKKIKSKTVKGLAIVDNKTGKVIQLESYSFKELEKKLGKDKSKCGPNSKCFKPTVSGKKGDCKIKPGAKSATCEGVVYVAKKQLSSKDAVEAMNAFINRKETRTFGEHPRESEGKYIEKSVREETSDSTSSKGQSK